MHVYLFRVQGQHGGRGKDAQGQRWRTRTTRPGTGTAGHEIAGATSARRKTLRMLFGERFVIYYN